ncbi:MAG: hypothetical protein WBD20_04385 [Pirellulaceae bacterium]
MSRVLFCRDADIVVDPNRGVAILSEQPIPQQFDRRNGGFRFRSYDPYRRVLSRDDVKESSLK